MLRLITLSVLLATSSLTHAQSIRNSLSQAPSPLPAGQTVRVVESEGRGHTAIEARKAAATVAIEQAVGVFVDSRRRSEMRMSDDKLQEVVDEKVQTFSSAFVDKIETIFSRPDGESGFVVRLRASVVVSELLDVMKQADIPVTQIDAASTQTKFATQDQQREDATQMVASRLQDVPKLFKITASDVTTALFEADNSIAIVQGTIDIIFDRNVLGEFAQLYESFRGYSDKEDGERSSGKDWRDNGWKRKGDSVESVFYICRENFVGQRTGCHGERVVPTLALRKFEHVFLKFQLIAGSQEVAQVRANVNFNCPNPSRSSGNYPYLSGTSESDNSDYFIDYSRKDKTLYGDRSKLQRLGLLREIRSPGSPIALRISRPEGPPVAVESLCAYQDVIDNFHIVLTGGNARSLPRSFILYGPRNIIEQVDGLRISAGVD